MLGKSMLLAGLLLSSNAGEASMNGQTVHGEILDARIADCGVRVDGDGLARLRPFIETSQPLAGSFSISVTKRSRSGTSVSSQSNRFAAVSLGNVVLAVDSPSQVGLDMQVTASDGTPLCRLSTTLELGEPEMRL